MHGGATIYLDCIDSDYLGLVFKGETDVMYHQQAGGTSCSHPLVEGFFVPLSGSPPEPEEDPFHDHGPEEYGEDDRARVEKLIDALGLDRVLEAPAVHELAEEWWSQVCEAWVPVKVKADATGYSAAPVEDLKGRVGVLTYPNSD